MHGLVRPRLGFFSIISASLLQACASVQPVVYDPDVRLVEYRDVTVRLATDDADGLEVRTTSVVADRASVESTELRSARDAALAALAELRFRLMEAGFRLVESPDQASATVELALSGLEADGRARQAIVEVREIGAGRTIAMVRARGAWGDEPADALVGRAARELGRRLWGAREGR